MPNIVMCMGIGQPLINGGRTCAKSTAEQIDCPKKEKCHRFKAIRTQPQMYLAGIPYDPDSGICKSFLPVEEDVS